MMYWLRLASVLALFTNSTSLFASDSADRPNIVLIFADDMGFGDVTCFDAASQIATPNLDRLASQGMKCTDAHSASAVCTPSRYALLTGRYCWRTELKKGVLGGFSPPLLKPQQLTMAELLQQADYRTACFGKWHLGLGWHGGIRQADYAMRNTAEGIDFDRPIQDGPLQHGFDYYFGIAASLDMPPYVFIENDRVLVDPTSTLSEEDSGGRNGPAAVGWRHKYVLPRLGDKVIEFLEDSREEPFFVYMPLNAPHTPHAPGDSFVGSSQLDIYGDFMVEVDHTIGRVLRRLDELRLSENTLVIVTSDNGPETNMFPRLAQYGHDSSSKYLGAKRDNWEGGHRVPLIVRWPGVVEPATVCDEPVSLVDLWATVADLTQTEIASDQGVDSVSILPLLKGKDAHYRREHAIVHHSSTGQFGIRRGDWKLLLHSGSGGNGYAAGKRASRYQDTLEQTAFDTGPRQLYNLREDPYETTNLALVKPDLVDELTDLAKQYVERGRSTPGPDQPSVHNNWVQYDEWAN